MEAQRTITMLLGRLRAGERAAADELMPLVYAQLRALADRYLRDERPGHTLQATALVHEAYIRLTGDRAESWEDRTHFFAAAAGAIRRILVEYARRRSRIKRGGGLVRAPLIEEQLHDGEPADRQMIALDDALDQLAEIDPCKARIVELRFFAGLTVDEVAAVTDVSPSTVARDWRLTRAWLKSQLEEVRSSAT